MRGCNRCMECVCVCVCFLRFVCIWEVLILITHSPSKHLCSLICHQTVFVIRSARHCGVLSFCSQGPNKKRTSSSSSSLSLCKTEALMRLEWKSFRIWQQPLKKHQEKNTHRKEPWYLDLCFVLCLVPCQPMELFNPLTLRP